MYGMPICAATYSITGTGSHADPVAAPICPCASHSSGITALAARSGG